MRTSSVENLKQNAPYYMLKTKTKKPENSIQSSRDDRNSLNAGSKAESSLSRTSSSTSTLMKPKKAFFDLKQSNTEITKKLEREYLHRNLEENTRSNIPTTSKVKKERSVSKDKKASEDLVRKILSSPQVKPSSANQESSKKNEALMKSFSPKFNLDSIYSHKYLLSATKSPMQSPTPDEMSTSKIEVKEFNMASATKEPPSQKPTGQSRANSRAPSVGERASSSTNATNTGSIRSNSKQRDSESSKDGSTKVFDRLYQEKGLKTLFGRNTLSGPNISLKDIQFSRMGELKMKETTIRGPRYDPGSIASPKIVNYWINSSKENNPNTISTKSFEASRMPQHFSASNLRSPVVVKAMPIKISETFTSTEAPKLSRNNSQIFSPNPEVLKQNEVQTKTQEFLPYQSSNQDFIQEALINNNREILRDSTNYYPEPTETTDTATLKPNMRELATEKLRLLQKEIAYQNQNQNQNITEEEEEEVTPYKPTLLKAPSDLKAPLSMIDEGVECSSAAHSRKQSRSSILDSQPAHFHYYIQSGL